MIHGAVALTFLLMVFDDSENKRMWFFYSYTIAAIVILFLTILVLAGVIGGGTAVDVEVMAEKTCKAMSS